MIKVLVTVTVREKSPNTVIFWFIFSCIRSEYGDLLCKSLYSIRIQEMRIRENSVFGHFLCSETISLFELFMTLSIEHNWTAY